MFLLFFEAEDGNSYSVFLSFDWLENYIEKLGIDEDDFLKNYDSKDVIKIIDVLDECNQPYTIQEEHQFSGFAD